MCVCVAGFVGIEEECGWEVGRVDSWGWEGRRWLVGEEVDVNVNLGGEEGVEVCGRGEWVWGRGVDELFGVGT